MQNKIESLFSEIERVFRGKHETVELALVALFSGGHLLLEDVPGTGKTTLATTLARALGMGCKRIQFTSDLLPSDVTGVSVLDPSRGEFVFKPGPLFANIVLADEINRSTPRTQSSLLEAMNEGHVTVDNLTHPLPRPFMVIATQNPLELHGTYPLPESQLDRFLVRLEIGYPDGETERGLFRDYAFTRPQDQVAAVLSAEEVLAVQAQVDRVHISDKVLEYIYSLVQATRHADTLVFGLSTRAGIHLYRAAKALALVRRRDFVLPDDVHDLYVPVCAHRLASRGATGKSREARWVLAEILNEVPIPVA